MELPKCLNEETTAVDNIQTSPALRSNTLNYQKQICEAEKSTHTNAQTQEKSKSSDMAKRLPETQIKSSKTITEESEPMPKYFLGMRRTTVL